MGRNGIIRIRTKKNVREGAKRNVRTGAKKNVRTGTGRSAGLTVRGYGGRNHISGGRRSGKSRGRCGT